MRTGKTWHRLPSAAAATTFASPANTSLHREVRHENTLAAAPSQPALAKGLKWRFRRGWRVRSRERAGAAAPQAWGDLASALFFPSGRQA